MQRMDATQTLATRPAPNPTSSPGWANNDLTGAAPPTILDPDWCNGIQAELEAIIAAGTPSAVLSKTTLNQVLTAIQALISQSQQAGAGQLQYVSTSQIAFVPKNGSTYRSGGALYQIPSGGITAASTNVTVNGVAAQNLAATSTYLVSVNGAAGTLKYWSLGTYSHMADTTAGNVGTEVISNGGAPLTAETLVGMVLTDGSGQFQSSPTVIGVLSWFNRAQLSVSNSASSATVTNASLQEITASARCLILTWGDETVSGIASGDARNNTANNACGFALSFDGSTDSVQPSIPMPAGTNVNTTVVAPCVAKLSEGSHYVTALGSSGSGPGTATFDFGIYATAWG